MFTLSSAFHAQNKVTKDIQLDQKEVAIQTHFASEGILSKFTPNTNEHQDNFNKEKQLQIDFAVKVSVKDVQHTVILLQHSLDVPAACCNTHLQKTLLLDFVTEVCEKYTTLHHVCNSLAAKHTSLA